MKKVKLILFHSIITLLLIQCSHATKDKEQASSSPDSLAQLHPLKKDTTVDQVLFYKNYYVGTIDGKNIVLELTLLEATYSGRVIISNDTLLYGIHGYYNGSDVALSLHPVNGQSELSFKGIFTDGFSSIKGTYADESLKKVKPLELHLAIEVTDTKLDDYTIGQEHVTVHLEDAILCKKIEDVVNSTMNEIVESWIERISGNEDEIRYDLGVTFTLDFISKTSVNFTLGLNEYWGGAHGSSEAIFKNYCIKSSDLIEINAEDNFKTDVRVDSMFYCPDNKRIYTSTKDLQRDNIEKESCFCFGDEGIESKVFLRPINGNLCIQYQYERFQSTDAESFNGVVIPYSKLKPFLNPLVYENFK